MQSILFLLLPSLLSLSTALPNPFSLHSLSNALPSPSAPSPLQKRSNLTDCEDVLDNGLNATCYDTLLVDAYIKRWNTTTTTCEKNELWANCFMREVGVPAEEGLGCAQVGPNTCNEPTADLVATATPQEVYTAFNIWALQQLYTAIYVDLTGDNGTQYISSAWANLTAPITSKSLLATILFADNDPRTEFLGLQISSDIPIPRVDDTPIANQGAAKEVIGNVLAAYLLSAMTNFTLGGYWGMAQHGKLMV